MKHLSLSVLATMVIAGLLQGCAAPSVPESGSAMSSVNAADVEDAIARERDAQKAEASSAAHAALYAFHQPLSKEQTKSGLLYTTGGWVQPLSLYYLGESGSGAVQIATLDMSDSAQSTAFQILDGKLFYVSADDQIGVYDLVTTERSTITLTFDRTAACDDGYGLIQDFLIANDRILVISRECVNYEQVSRLRSFDIKGGKGRLVANVSAIAVDSAGIAFQREMASATSVRLKSAYIDAGAGFAKIYDVAVATGGTTKVAEVSYEDCEDPATCTAKILSDNRAFEQYFPWSDPVQCGTWKVDKQGSLLLSRSGTDLSIAGATFIACLQE